MKLGRVETALLALALAAVFFAAGYFLGRSVTGDIDVVVERRDAVSAPEGGEDLVDINSAGAEELATLPGIGEELARRIIEYRTEHGGFPVKEALMNVPGVGQALYDALEDLIKI